MPPFVLHSIKSTFGLVLGAIVCLSVFTTLVFLESQGIATLPSPWSALNTCLLNRFVLWTLDIIITTAIAEVWAVQCRGQTLGLKPQDAGSDT